MQKQFFIMHAIALGSMKLPNLFLGVKAWIEVSDGTESKFNSSLKLSRPAKQAFSL